MKYSKASGSCSLPSLHRFIPLQRRRMALFRISPNLTMSGNKYSMLYVGTSDNKEEAKICLLELDKNSGEWSYNNRVESGDSDSSGHYVDSDTYGPASNMFEFQFEVEE